MNQRSDILKKEKDIRQWISEHKSKAFICQMLSCKPLTLNTYLKKMGINYEGVKGQRGKKEPYVPIEEYLNNNKPIQSYKLKNRLIRDKIKGERCEQCGLTEWQGKTIPLELHHIDGNNYNNNINNLKILCPNCHALTDGYRGRGIKAYKKKKELQKISKTKINKTCIDCGKEISRNATRCKSCAKKIQKRKSEHPTREELKKLIRNKPMLQIGLIYGVTDNAIRKWCKGYQLPFSSKQIKSYTKEEWDLI